MRLVPCSAHRPRAFPGRDTAPGRQISWDHVSHECRPFHRDDLPKNLETPVPHDALHTTPSWPSTARVRLEIIVAPPLCWWDDEDVIVFRNLQIRTHSVQNHRIVTTFNCYRGNHSLCHRVTRRGEEFLCPPRCTLAQPIVLSRSPPSVSSRASHWDIFSCIRLDQRWTTLHTNRSVVGN